MTLALAFLLIGFLAGAINATAGGGSLLSIALLVEYGLPAPVANATNRVAVLVQTLGSGARFRRDGVMPSRELIRFAPLSIAGAGLGAYIAANVPDEPFRLGLAVLFGVIGTALIVRSIRPSESVPEPQAMLTELQLQLTVFAIGIYAGFIQAGVGLLLLLVLHIGHGMDVARSNALKIALIAVWTALALAIFWHEGLVRWLPGAWLGVGGIAGGWFGAGVVQRMNPRLLRGTVGVALWVAAVRFVL